MQTSNDLAHTRTSRFPSWTRRGASVLAVVALAAGCASSADDVPSSTLGGPGASVLNPEAEVPQVGLEPGSNLPPGTNNENELSPESTMPGVVGG